MKIPFKFRNLFLAKGLYFESWVEYKRTILTGQVLILTFCIGLIYSALNIFKGINLNLSLYILLALLSIVFFWINRQGKQILAASLILLVALILVFYFTSVESTLTGAYLFYVANCIGAFALLGYENRKVAIVYCIFTLFAFQFSYVDIFNLYDESLLTKEYVHTNYIINFISSMLACILIVYFLMNLNYASEKSLKENELILKESNEMLSKANTELDRFVYSTSHDLKAPLSSMLGLVQIAEKIKDKEELNNYFQMMKGRISTMDNFIVDITNYSRNSRTEIQINSIKLLDLANEVIDSHKFSEGIKEIKTLIDIDEHLVLHTDKDRLKIILNNLINNSIKYRNPRKETLIRLSANRIKDETVITVQDNGLGIGEEHLDKIFNMFYRASELSKGSGLGLYIVKETVDKIGGTISVKSIRDEGTDFTIRIPSA